VRGGGGRRRWEEMIEEERRIPSIVVVISAIVGPIAEVVKSEVILHHFINRPIALHLCAPLLHQIGDSPCT